MKTLVYLMCSFCFLASGAKAQEKRYLDWQKFSKSITETKIIEPVPYGKFTIFQIENINKFLYKVEMSGKSIELQTPIPSELQTLFRLNSKELEAKAETKKADEAVNQVASSLLLMEAEEKSLDKKIEAFEDKEVVTPPDPKKSSKDNKKTMKELVAEKEEEKEKERENEIYKDLVTQFQETLAKCKEYLEVGKVLSSEIFELKHTRNKLVSIAQFDLSFNEIGVKLATINPPSESIKNHYHDFKALYIEVETLYERTEATAEMLDQNNVLKKDLVKTIKTASGKIEKADILMDEETLLALYDEVEFLYSELGNKNNFTAVAPPVQMDDDMVTYKINITPTATRSLTAFRNPMEFKFDVPTRGGLKTDFSVGPVVSFGKNARDHKYYKDSTGELQELKNKNEISPSLAALMHFYARSGKSTSYGGLFGIGVGFQSTSDVNASLFFGASIVMGKKQKIMLNGGVSYLRVERLQSDQYKIGEGLPADTDISTVTEKVFKPSPFLSISYNITTKIEN